MWNPFARQKPEAEEAEGLYRALLRQSRSPALYASYGVADSLDGRFDLLVLHACLLLRRLRREGAGEKVLAQQVFDALFRDMDTVLREIGVGDLSVGRRIREMAEAFYGRAKAYDDALAGGEAALAAALARNIYRSAAADPRSERLARYARSSEDALSAAPLQELRAGRLPFPAPEAVT